MWLKRSSPQNIVIGGAAGAVPVLVGWPPSRAGSLARDRDFVIVFLWTPRTSGRSRCDTNATTRRRASDAPRGRRVAATTRQIQVYTLILVAATLALVPPDGWHGVPLGAVGLGSSSWPGRRAFAASQRRPPRWRCSTSRSPIWRCSSAPLRSMHSSTCGSSYRRAHPPVPGGIVSPGPAAPPQAGTARERTDDGTNQALPRHDRGRGALLLLCQAVLASKCRKTRSTRWAEAHKIKRPVLAVFWIAVGCSVLVEGTLVFALARFRRRAGAPCPSRFTATRAWRSLDDHPGPPAPGRRGADRGDDLLARAKPPGSLNLTVTGHQWWWQVEYPSLT